jgi:hypothetical protein
MPKTISGWWSVGLIIAMVVLVIVGMSLPNTLYEAVPAGKTILKDIGARPALALSMLAGFGTGVAAFITGLISIIRQKERNLLVYLSTSVGAGLIIFLLAEIMFPH